MATKIEDQSNLITFNKQATITVLGASGDLATKKTVSISEATHFLATSERVVPAQLTPQPTR